MSFRQTDTGFERHVVRCPTVVCTPHKVLKNHKKYTCRHAHLWFAHDEGFAMNLYYVGLHLTNT